MNGFHPLLNLSLCAHKRTFRRLTPYCGPRSRRALPSFEEEVVTKLGYF
jgi:hypothetical protein